MPDFERILDSLREDIAQSPEGKSYEKGFTAGKTRARIEVVAVAVALYFLVALIGRIAGGAS